MNIVAELSLYPLTAEPIPAITEFIQELRRHDGLQIVTNQLSTQLRGDFDVVTHAVNECMKATMSSDHTVVLVAKYLNVEHDLAKEPRID